MKMQIIRLVLFLLLLLPLPSLCQPALPPDPFLGAYYFEDTNWLSVDGDAPIAFSNLVSVALWNKNALLLDTTNAVPAFLNYNVVESDGSTNITFDQGAFRCVFITDWATADTNQNGTGPGQTCYLIAAGDFTTGSPDGLWTVFIDSGGTNILLTAQIDERRTTGNVPIEFYGKVLDQDGAPLEHAKVTLEQTVGHLTSPTKGYETYDKAILQTDANGAFVLNHTKGMLLKIVSIEKPGYQLSKKTERYFAYNVGTDIFHPDPNEPVIFKMWKLQGQEPLANSGWKGNVSCDGTTNIYDLATGRRKATGDLNIVCVRKPLTSPPPGKGPFDYSFKIEVHGGGVQPTADEFTYRAPETGYTPKFIEEKRANESGWRGRLNQEFYIKTADGHYGRLSVDWYAAQSSPTHLDWNCSINPSGSRNLER